MSVASMARLYALKNIVGLKVAPANLAPASQLRLAMGPYFIQLSGEAATALGYTVVGQTVSTLPGTEGNVEYFLHLRAPGGAP